MNPFSWLYYRLAPLALRRMLRSRRYMAFCRWLGRPVPIAPGRLLIACAADARAVLGRANEFGMPYQAAMEELDTPFILGLNPSPAYRRQRAALNEALKPVDLNRLGTVTRRESEALLGHGPGEIDLIGELTDEVLATTVSAVLWSGPPLTKERLKQAREVARHIFVNPLHDPGIRRCAAAGAPTLRKATNAMIRGRRSGGAQPRDVMARLGTLSSDGDDDANEPIDDILGLMVAWITSVSRTMGFAFDELLRPERARQLELAQVAARNGDEDTVVAVLFEALRFRPSMPALDRVCTREARVNGHRIKRGTHLWVALTGAMMDGREYTDPRQFRENGPDRAYLHFGHERRHCPGEAIARCQLAAISIALLRRPDLRRRSSLKLDGPYPSRLKVSYGAIPPATVTTFSPASQPSRS